MPLGFPSNPQVGDTYTLGNSTWVWNGTAWQLTSTVTSYDPFTVVRLIATTSTNSTGTDTGGVVVYGGVGIGKDLYVGGKAYASGSEVLTTATVNQFASQTAIFAGTDTAVNTSTGNITIWNTSNLQSITDRGSSTTNAIFINNATVSSSTITGALKIAGGVGVGGNLHVGGEIVAQKLVIEYTTITTTIVESDDIIKTSNTTQSNDTTTGALIVSGGAGIGKNLNVGGEIFRNGISVGYGYTGSLGFTGSVGFTGSKGDTGFTGSRGETGFTGSQGTIGFTGSRGETGFTGSRGETGFTGSRGETGFTGSRGETGFTGSQGIIGFTGSGGFTGSRGPSDAIKATDDTASTTLYPVMVNAAGSDQVPKVTTSKLYFNAATGVLTIIGEIVADKLTIQYTTVTTTLVQTDDIIQTLNSTQSTSTQSGALVVAGGAGIGGNVFVGGQMSVGSPEVVGGLTVNYSAATTLLLQRVSDDSGPPEAIGRKSRGTLNAKTSVIANDRLWFFAAAGYYGTEGVDGAWSGNQVGMNFVASENWTATARGTHITWATTQAGQISRTDKMRLTGDGKLGINTAAPEAVLHVVGDAKITGITTITNVTQSTSTITGAFVVDGGAGIQKDLYVGGTIYGTFGGTISTATNAANVAITNETASIAPHYVTFVTTSTSVAPIKTSAISGLVYFPSPGSLAINNSTATDSSGYGGSVLDIKGPIYVRQFNSTINFLGLGVNSSNSYINAEGVSNKLLFRVSGSEKMRISALGNVGIGSTAPDTITNTSAPHLVVKGMGDLIIAQATTTTNGEVAIGPDYIYQTQNQSIRIGTNNTQKAVLTNDGKLGLGVLAPRAAVDLGSANNVGQVLLLGETTANNRVGFGLDSATAGMRIFTVNNNSQFIDVGGISAGDGITWTRNHSLGIAGKNSWVNEQGGNFGVYVTNPTERLEVQGNTLIYGAAGAIGTGLAYYLGPSNNSRDLSITRVAAGTLGIGRYVSGAWSESVRITNAASVGINTTNPAAGLDVAKLDIRYGVNSGPGLLQVYEAENASIGKTGGTVSNDTTGSGGQIWGTSDNSLLYGPYNNLPRGSYRLSVRMKITDVTYAGTVARILIYLNGTAYNTQERFVRASDFRANDIWETISVPFNINEVTNGNVEYYIQGQNSRQIYVDYMIVTNDLDSYSQHVWGNLGINTNPIYKFHLNNNGNTTQAFYVDAGNLNATQVLFEHTGSNTPVPFAIRKSGYSGNSQAYSVLNLDMAHNVVGGGSNLHFTLRNSASNVVEYGGIGAYITTNSSGSESGNLALYTTSGGATRQQRVTVRYDGNVGINVTNPTYKLEVSGSFAATTKSFVIDHPTKPNMKLRYGSLEGPENGVYVRGKIKGTDTIHLPDYWTKLVDPNTITVTLTPVGRYQKLFVKDIKDNQIIIGNDNLLKKEIDCFYVVYGERADVEKLISEIYIE